MHYHSTARLAGGLTSLLKDGYKHFSGLEDAIVRNIEACRGLAVITRTSLGPNAMNKLVVNHLEKIFVTSDAATIVQELEVAHPAARMLTMAAKMQEQEMGDGTNFVITFAGAVNAVFGSCVSTNPPFLVFRAGELLSQAEGLLRIGVHASEIVEGYRKASVAALRILEELSCRYGSLLSRHFTACPLLSPLLDLPSLGALQEH